MIQDNTLLGFLAGIVVIGVLLAVVIVLTKKAVPKLDVNKYRTKWLEIEQALKKDEQSTYFMTVMNADKLLDQALKERGIKGDTMGARMKTAQETWSNANAVWSAHKVRNRIAHETDVHIGYDEARRALASFKQALKDIGAI